jgi:hypothetical protein
MPSSHRNERLSIVADKAMCTLPQVQSALTQNTYPGQNPNQPVGPTPSRVTATVTPFGIPFSGPISTRQLSNGCVANFTRLGHPLHPGSVTRCVVSVGPYWGVRTIGVGLNDNPFEAMANDLIGVSEFGKLDDRMERQLDQTCDG